MTFDLEEQEKIDALKDWWKRYGTALILVVLLVSASAAAIQGWRLYQYKQTEQAATLYGNLQNLKPQNDAKKIREIAGAIIDKYPKTSYAPRAALIAAHANYEANDAKSAKAQLQWVIEHTKEQALKQIASLRLAGVLLDEKNYTEALKLLDKPFDPAFAGLTADLKGDVLAAQGKQTEARAAYQIALDKTDQKSVYRKFVQMKLDALGEGK